MPKDLLYASFKDAPYTSQFVGSIQPELKEAQQVLNQTYDLSKESDSKLAAVARDMSQKAHPKDTQAAQALFEDYSAKLAERAKAGNYERMLHETTNDARQFNVNASKIVAEKQRVDAYIKQLDEDKTINDADKADLKRMALSGQNSLQYDKTNGLVVGEGFKEDPFASDYNFAEKIDQGFGKGFIPDIIGGAGSQITTDKATGLPMLVDSKGKTTFVKPQDIEQAVGKYLTDDPNAQAHIDREARKIAFKAGYKDWRNIPKDLYNQAHQQAAYNLTNNAIKAAGIKYGFKQTESDTSARFLPSDYMKAITGGGEGKVPSVQGLQVMQDVQTNNPYFDKKEYDFNKKAFDNPSRLDQLKDKFSDPLTGDRLSGTEIIKRFNDFKANPENKDRVNPYTQIRTGVLRKASMQGLRETSQDPIKAIEETSQTDPLVRSVKEELYPDFNKIKSSSKEEQKKVADNIQKALNSKTQHLQTKDNKFFKFDAADASGIDEYLIGDNNKLGYITQMSYVDNDGKTKAVSELLDKEFGIDVNNIDDITDPKKIEKIRRGISTLGFAVPDGSNSIYKAKVGTKTINLLGSEDQKQEFNEVNKIGRLIHSGINEPIDVQFNSQINGFDLSGHVIPQDFWDKTDFKGRDAVIILDEDASIPGLGKIPAGTPISYSDLLNIQFKTARTLNPNRRNKQAGNSDVYQKPDIQDNAILGE